MKGKPVCQTLWKWLDTHIVNVFCPYLKYFVVCKSVQMYLYIVSSSFTKHLSPVPELFNILLYLLMKTYRPSIRFGGEVGEDEGEGGGCNVTFGGLMTGPTRNIRINRPKSLDISLKLKKNQNEPLGLVKLA